MIAYIKAVLITDSFQGSNIKHKTCKAQLLHEVIPPFDDNPRSDYIDTEQNHFSFVVNSAYRTEIWLSCLQNSEAGDMSGHSSSSKSTLLYFLILFLSITIGLIEEASQILTCFISSGKKIEASLLNSILDWGTQLEAKDTSIFWVFKKQNKTTEHILS